MCTYIYYIYIHINLIYIYIYIYSTPQYIHFFMVMTSEFGSELGFRPSAPYIYIDLKSSEDFSNYLEPSSAVLRSLNTVL